MGNYTDSTSYLFAASTRHECLPESRLLSPHVLESAAPASSLIWKNAPVKGNALLVLQALARFANANMECRPSTGTLASMTKLSRRHVIRVLRDLRAKNLIAFDDNPGGKGRTHHFRLLVKGDTARNGDISRTRKSDIAQRGTKSHEKGDTAHPPSVEDLSAQLDALTEENLLHAIEKGEPLTGTFKCELHGSFEREGCRFRDWVIWKGYEEIYSCGWSEEAGCTGCRDERGALRARKRPDVVIRKFELEVPTTCPVHGQIIVTAHAVSSNLYGDLSISSDLCAACNSAWQEQVYLQEQLGLTPDQWNLPGVGDQILDALRRAECQQGGVQ
jgi:hypothetical protein